MIVGALEGRAELQEGVREGEAVRSVQGAEDLQRRLYSTQSSAGERPRRLSGDPRRRRGAGTHRDNVGVAHHRVRERERDDDLDAERGHEAVHGDVLHRVEKVQVALGRLRGLRRGDWE